MASGQKSCFFLSARPRTRLVSSFVGRRLLLLRSYVTFAPLFPHNSVKLPGLFSLRGKIRGFGPKKLLLLVRSPSNAACQQLCRSPLAVAPVLRNFAAVRPPLFFFAPGLLSCAGREWKLALGSGSWVGGIEIETFDELCFEKSTSRNL